MCNGTAATHLVAKGLKNNDPEIETLSAPNSGYVTAWKPFLFTKEYNLVIGKNNTDTWNLDFEYAQETVKYHPNSAILAVHNVGNPTNVPKLNTLGVPVVEDACEALFGTYDGKPVGSQSLVSSFSFFGNKTVTSGEGGAVVTNDDDLALYLKKLRGQGQTHRRYIHHQLGYNYRMTNVQAAILNGQLDCLSEIMQKKQAIWERYHSAFKDNYNLFVQTVDSNSKHSSWMFGVGLKNRDEPFDFKQKAFNSRGVDIRPMFYPANVHTHLNINNRVKIVSNEFWDKRTKSIIMLPSYPELEKDEQLKVIETVIDYAEGRI